MRLLASCRCIYTTNMMQRMTLTKYRVKRLDGNYIRKLSAVFNKTRKQHPIKRQLYSHESPLAKIIQIR